MSQAYAPGVPASQRPVAYVQNTKNGAVYIANEYLARLPYIQPYHGPIPAPPQPITTAHVGPQNAPQSVEAFPVQPQYAQPQQGFPAPEPYAPPPQVFESGDYRPPMEGPMPQEVHQWDVPGFWYTPEGMACLSSAARHMQEMAAAMVQPALPSLRAVRPMPPLVSDDVHDESELEAQPAPAVAQAPVAAAPVVRRRPPPRAAQG